MVGSRAYPLYLRFGGHVARKGDNMLPSNEAAELEKLVRKFSEEYQAADNDDDLGCRMDDLYLEVQRLLREIDGP